MKGNSKIRVYSAQELRHMVEDAEDAKTLCSIVFVAIGQYSQKKLPRGSLAAVLIQCGERLLTF